MVQRAWRPLQAALQPAPRRDGKGARRRPEAVRAFARTRRLGSWQSGRRRKGRQKRWREVIRWDGSSSPFPRPPSSCVYTRDTLNPVWRAEARPAPRPAKSSLACLSCPTSLPAPSRLCSRVPRGRAPPPPPRAFVSGASYDTPFPPRPSRPTSVEPLACFWLCGAVEASPLCGPLACMSPSASPRPLRLGLPLRRSSSFSPSRVPFSLVPRYPLEFPFRPRWLGGCLRPGCRERPGV